MSDLKRFNGFVVGSDTTPEGKVVWKVRVKDSACQYDQLKLIVVSVREGIELARGLNVNFIIGNMDGSRGEKLLRAVDVCVEAAGACVKTETKDERSEGGLA